MNLRRMLKNPVALIAQGFAVGALLFIVSNPVAPLDGAPAPEPAAESILSNLNA